MSSCRAKGLITLLSINVLGYLSPTQIVGGIRLSEGKEIHPIPFIIIIAVLQIGRSLVRSQLVPLQFFVDTKSFQSHYGPAVDSASNRNEYQEHFLGVKAAGV